MDVIEAIRGRASTRAFLDQEVSRETVEQILEAARWAPSGTNTQPWQVAVAGRKTMSRIGNTIVAALNSGAKHHPDYPYYPKEFVEPYQGRRVECGMALYGALDIDRKDYERRKAQWYKNYHGFGAPIVLFAFVDKAMEQGSWVDCGMFLQSIMLAARGLGLETCPQAALAEFPDLVRAELDMPSSLDLICGIALGYPDLADPVNNYRTTRIEVEDFTTWRTD
ncbi:MAG: nitroreductase [Verrucomicrobiota bacterium]